MNMMIEQDMLNIDAMHSACVIDENGNEIPITREMIEQSCEQLASQSHKKNN